MPQLDDPNFERSVVLLLHHDDEGAMGVVINRRTEVGLDAFCRKHELTYGGAEDRCVHLGGPCEQQRGFLLHQEPALTAQHVELLPGLHLSTEAESVRAVLAKSGAPYTFLLGYSGWGPGQLEHELVDGAWLTSPVRLARIFEADTAGVWTRVLGDLGIEPARLQLSTERH